MKNVKIGMSSFGDIQKYKKQGLKRLKEINQSNKNNLYMESNTNKVASVLHPNLQWVVVKEIINETRDCKTFVLMPIQGEKLAYFKAGQYIDVFVDLKGERLNRPYSLSSSPKQALEGEYRITVKAVDSGIVSNYLLGTLNVGEKLLISEPMGTLTYNPLRDEKHIVAIAGGCGVAPFYSLAQAIIDGDEDCILTLFYGAKKEEDLLFLEGFDDIVSKTNKVKVIYVLSNEDNAKYEHGLINRKLIEKYVDKHVSYFVSGPEEMYHYLNKELKTLNLPNKFFRYELPASKSKPTGNVYMVRVKIEQNEFLIDAWENETLMTSLNRAHIVLPSRCHQGICGWCRTKLLSGEVSMDNDYRHVADIKYNYIHPCVTYPKSDLILEIIK